MESSAVAVDSIFTSDASDAFLSCLGSSENAITSGRSVVGDEGGAHPQQHAVARLEGGARQQPPQQHARLGAFDAESAVGAGCTPAVVRRCPAGCTTIDVRGLLLTLLEVASALGYLHRVGIVHCDIKVRPQLPPRLQPPNLIAGLLCLTACVAVELTADSGRVIVALNRLKKPVCWLSWTCCQQTCCQPCKHCLIYIYCRKRKCVCWIPWSKV